MKKVLIIGNCGSGKSYFAKKLALKTNLPLVHLDRIYWIDNKNTLSKNEFDKRLKIELEKEEWIIDGNYNRTLRHRLEYCDTVFYFDVSTLTSLRGVISRTFKNFGKSRDDISENRVEHIDLMFFKLIKNVLTFKRKHRKYYYRLLDLSKGIDVFIFKSRKEAEAYIDNK